VTKEAGTVLARVDAIADGGALGLTACVDGLDEALLLLRHGAAVRVFRNVCPHAGRPLDWAPGRFLIEAGMVICSAHGASFGIPDGRCIFGPCRGQSLYEVSVHLVDGEVRLL
jgi:nitrite reductase/ring-hydroxylating ferredoxin subunit